MKMIRVTLLTNILPPYRVSYLNEFAALVNLTVIVNALTTPDRSWHVDTASLRFDLQVESGISMGVRRFGAAKHAETRYLQVANRTIPMLRKAAPDIIVSAELGSRTAQAALYARWRRIPMICYWEGTPHTEASISATRRIWRKLLVGGIDAAWVNGAESQDYLVSLGVPAQRTTLNMTGVDTNYFRTEAERLYPSREARRAELGLRGLVFGYSGTLSSRKGISQYLRALTVLANSSHKMPFSVLFIGDGDQRQVVEEWSAAHRGVPLHITGFQQLEKLPEYYVCADWFVLPTLEDCWALATVEPIACGLPQVFSKYNGASADLIRYPGAGVLTDPLDLNQFSEVLMEVLRAGPRRLAPEVVASVVDTYGAKGQARRAAHSASEILAAHLT